MVSQLVGKNALFVMCNPLLDMVAEVNESFLNKYNLKSNDAILAGDEHKALYEDLEKNFKVEYIAGGSAQNTCRAAQLLLPQGSTVYFGCTGDDQYFKILEKAAVNDGLNVRYQRDITTPTGTCAVLVNGHSRSLVANLAAANNYKKEHLLLEENQKIMKEAKVFYISGFFLTVSPSSIQHVATHAAETGKIFTMNLSAPFLSQFFKEPQLKALPYVDILFGNETEAKAFGDNNGFNTADVKEIALKIAALEKVNKGFSRIVIISQGSDPTIVARDGVVTEYPVAPVPKNEIVDTNGAGDSFVGAFLSEYMNGEPLKKCIEAGHFLAGQVIRRSGCTFPPKSTLIDQIKNLH